MYYSFINGSVFCFATEYEYQLIVPMLHRVYGVPIDVVPESKLTDAERARIASVFGNVDSLDSIPF